MRDISVRAPAAVDVADGPTMAELRALEYEAPVIAAEMALLAEETKVLDVPRCPEARAWVNRARWRVIAVQAAVIGALATSLVGTPPDYGETR